ncbi:hypothetical protein HPB50_024055 [Hyalomma asiaticum]|uniref:Uncharacterized protein n=1 Tax=Hyalomma asiaticum TaxID=266040 RepID=A0ACB7SUT8_HYAAI|nr:hypothetical protein HPB50_024055 [Hyalomma asiaticum]
MTFPSTSMARCLLMVALLFWHGGVLTSVNSQMPVQCGKECGGYVRATCVEECHCVYYPGDLGICLPHGLNESDLP